MNKLAIAMALAASPALSEDGGALVSFQVVKPETALRLAQMAMKDCRGEGYRVVVAVVDRFGATQVFLRDRSANAHAKEAARHKTWSAVSFRADTITLAEQTESATTPSRIRHISQALPLGCVAADATGSLVCGVGASGATGADIDDICARAEIMAVEDELAF